MMVGWCMERYKRIFEGAWSEKICHLWERVLDLVFLWASVSPVSYICWIGELLCFSFGCPLFSVFYFFVSVLFHIFSLVVEFVT